MQVPRFVVAMFACAAVSCSGTAKPPTPLPSIVGTWTMEMDLGRTAAKAVWLGKPNATDAEIQAAAKEALAAAPPGPRFTFNADGTGSLEGMVFNHPIVDPISWELVEASTTSTSINTWTRTRPEKDPMVFS